MISEIIFAAHMSNFLTISIQEDYPPPLKSKKEYYIKDITWKIVEKKKKTAKMIKCIEL